MANVARIIKGIVLLVIAAFIIMVIVGVYTALDSVGAGYAYPTDSPSEAVGEVIGEDGGILARQSSAIVTDTSSAAGGATDGVAAPVSPDIDGSRGDGAGQPYPTVPSSPVASASASQSNTTSGGSAGTTSSPEGGSPGSGPSPAPTGSGSNSPAPAPSAPAKTYHPAWDEYVEDGYWQESVREATYGERPVYGSVCNECGIDISGRAAQHLKDSHHSGYHEGIVGYETYEITPAKTEPVWVDTSHWLRHEGYWE
jgi:hypothetical protein